MLAAHLLDCVGGGTRPAGTPVDQSSTKSAHPVGGIPVVFSGMPGIAVEIRKSRIVGLLWPFFRLDGLEVVELDANVIAIATELRANYTGSLRTPDAIKIACALSSRAGQFLTGDKKLAAITEVKVIIV